ncbi:MAG: CDP-diacylglycerol--serine O-phosphatidyltransferase [Gammaproteobacteria bacterium]|nr:CDP-diacylglycerol--serine O-phosphatidyltransferase [Gammaproteobacteria bacterium]
MPKKAKNLHSIDAKKPAKGIYVLPNLFTSAGLFAGFYAIMQARLGHFEAACLAIYVAMVMDIVDGRLARLTNTMSEFGSEYDSLSDMVSFGVAPAMVAYEFALSGLGKVGSLVAFIYIACAALRLARFNVQKLDDKKYFIGMPSPGAAALVASVIWVCVDYGIVPNAVAIGLAVLVAWAALTMVSNIRFRSFKDVDFRDKMPFIGMIVLVLAIAIIYLDPPLAFLAIGIIYMGSGTLLYAVNKTRRWRAQQSSATDAAPDE